MTELFFSHKFRAIGDDSETFTSNAPDHPRFSYATWGYIAGAAISVVGGVLTKPKAPKAAELQSVDPQDEQKRSLAGNAAAEGDIESLLSRANSFTQDQANGLMEKAVPGYGNLSKKFTDQANGMLDDPYSLPDDVSANISRLAAERGISIGTTGQTNDFSLLRDFGIDSLKYGESRINSAQSILSTVASLAPRVNPMSPMSMYITPAQQMTTAAANNSGQFNASQAQNNANAAASNANASMWGNIIGQVGGMTTGYLNNRDTSTPANTGSNPALPGDWHSTGN